MKISFTKKGLESLTVEAKRVVHMDTQVRGLCFRIEPSGKKSFWWLKKISGKPVWKNIGAFPDLSVENARMRAAEYNSQHARWKADGFTGGNPFVAENSLTLKDVFEDYIERHLRSAAKNPVEAEVNLRWQFNKYMPDWMSRKINSIQKKDILDLYYKLKKVGIPTANRQVEKLRVLFYWAEENMEWRGKNPATIKLISEVDRERTRFLDAEELQRLSKALELEVNRDLRDFVIIALMTGARRGDVLSMRWEDISFELRQWTVPFPKNRIKYDVPLLDGAFDVLKERRKRVKSSWVFPSNRSGSGHITWFTSRWKKLLAAAEIPDIRCHDLRRTFGSWLAIKGYSLPLIAKSLGHRSLSETSIYARLQNSTVREAMEKGVHGLL